MNLDDLSRAELLRRLYDKMSEDEKRAFIMMHLNGRSNSEIIRILQEQKRQLDVIEEQGSFVRDLGANVTGNVIYGGATWLLGRLLRAIK